MSEERENHAEGTANKKACPWHGGGTARMPVWVESPERGVVVI